MHVNIFRQKNAINFIVSKDFKKLERVFMGEWKKLTFRFIFFSSNWNQINSSLTITIIALPLH